MIKYFYSKKYWLSVILLAKASIKRQNADTFLGSLWTLVQPFANIIIISYFVGFLLRMPREQLIMNLVGAIPLWTFIVNSVNISANSLVGRAGILKKIIISRTIFPVSDSLTQLYSLVYSFIAMYLAFMILYPEKFTIWIIFAPVLAIPLIITVTATSIVFAFLTPYIRDIPQILNLILNIVYWTVPIIYPYSIVPDTKRIFYEINPVFLIIRPVQNLVIEGVMPDIFVIIKSWIVAVIFSMISYVGYRCSSKNIIYYL